MRSELVRSERVRAAERWKVRSGAVRRTVLVGSGSVEGKRGEGGREQKQRASQDSAVPDHLHT